MIVILQWQDGNISGASDLISNRLVSLLLSSGRGRGGNSWELLSPLLLSDLAQGYLPAPLMLRLQFPQQESAEAPAAAPSQAALADAAPVHAPQVYSPVA